MSASVIEIAVSRFALYRLTPSPGTPSSISS
jgi:hypothetical protein